MSTATVPRASPTHQRADIVKAPSPEPKGSDGDNRLAGWLRRAPWRTEEPHPGTVAAKHPEPAAVTVARVMDFEGFDVDDVVVEIERLGSIGPDSRRQRPTGRASSDGGRATTSAGTAC